MALCQELCDGEAGGAGGGSLSLLRRKIHSEKERATFTEVSYPLQASCSRPSWPALTFEPASAPILGPLPNPMLISSNIPLLSLVVVVVRSRVCLKGVPPRSREETRRALRQGDLAVLPVLLWRHNGARGTEGGRWWRRIHPQPQLPTGQGMHS